MSKNIFEKFKEKILEIEHIGSAIYLHEWDSNVNMPAKAAPFRGKTVATLMGLVHEKLLAKDFEAMLLKLKSDLDKNKLDKKQSTIVREVYRVYAKEKKLPADFVRELSQASAEGHHIWVEARKTNNFKKFAPQLSKLVDLKRKQAKLIGYKDSPYDALLDEFEPGLTSEEVSIIFYELKKFLVPFIKKIGSSKAKVNSKILTGQFDVDKQKELGRMVAEKLGYDLSAGRIDETAHPFMLSFNPWDARVTTRYKEDDFTFGLGSTIHEVGHALYEQGFDPEHFGTPLSSYISLGIHESQSRIWENRVGKSLPFWQYLYPTLQKYFPKSFKTVKLDQFYSALNAVEPSLIRIEADEVTYDLHIIIRFEIEKELIDGSIEVKDLPKIWNSKYKEYLGVNVPNDANGVLQDVHWSGGLFGYFPTYTLGNLYAAQFYQQAKKDIMNLEKLFTKGQFQPFLQWLRKNIHQHGKMYSAQQLCRRVTGENLNSHHYTAYLTEKFGDIYKS